MKCKFNAILLLAILFFSCEKDTVDWETKRFFPPHAILAENALMRFSDTITVYRYYTGTDTVAFGKSCVILWCENVYNPTELTKSLIYEDRGKVYMRLLGDRENLHNDWALLYDFSLPQWEIGDIIEWRKYNSSYTSPIDKLHRVTLLNGEKVQVAEDEYGYRLIYSIGYENCMFFNGELGILPTDGTRYVPICFYRNNELLWHHKFNK